MDPQQAVAQTPPPTPGGELTLDQLAAAATVPRPAFPDNALDAAISQTPPLGAPLTPPTPVQPATPTEALAQDASATRANGAEQAANATEKAGIDEQRAQDEAKYKEDHARAMREILARQESHRTAAESRVVDARAKAESAPYHTLFEDSSTGQNVVRAIGLILGGVSWNPAHVNRGVQLLETSMAQHDARQREKHADLWRSVEAAERGQSVLDTNQLRELSTFQSGEAARWDAIASRTSAMAAANKGKGDVTTAKKVALEASEKADTLWQNAAHADALAAHMVEEEKIARERNKIAASKVKKAGAGDGGVGAAQALADFSAAAGALKPGEAIPADVIKLGLKAKIKPSQVVDQIKKYQAEAKDPTLTIKPSEREFRDENGKVIGTIPARNAVAFAKQDANLSQAAQRLTDLAEDQRKTPTASTPEAIQRRATKYANAIIAVATTSPLGKTNEAIHQEAASIGLAGAVDPDHLVDSIKGILLKGGANPEAVEHKARESIQIRNQYRLQTLTPIAAKGGGAKADAGSHPDLVLKNKKHARWNVERGGYEEVD
jgi:hypothetical protein